MKIDPRPLTFKINHYEVKNLRMIARCAREYLKNRQNRQANMFLSFSEYATPAARESLTQYIDHLLDTITE